MEHHPSVLTADGVGAKHSLQFNSEVAATRSNLTELDLKNAEDMICIAVDLLGEHLVYEKKNLNPTNF